MDYKSYDLISETNSELENEIAFCIASARASGAVLVKFVFGGDGERLIGTAQKILRALKRAKRVEFFELSDNLKTDTTEARFFRNKYTEFAESCSSEHMAIVVKI